LLNDQETLHNAVFNNIRDDANPSGDLRMWKESQKDRKKLRKNRIKF
jgi:hypothetical protein